MSVALGRLSVSTYKTDQTVCKLQNARLMHLAAVAVWAAIGCRLLTLNQARLRGLAAFAAGAALTERCLTGIFSAFHWLSSIRRLNSR